MAVERHPDPSSFRVAAEPFAARSPATRDMLDGWVDWLAREPPEPRESLYLATYANGDRLGVAFRRGDHALRIEDSDAEAAIAFARHIARGESRLAGVVGSERACEAFIAEWRVLTGRSHALRMHLRSHVLTEVSDVDLPAGGMRAATVADTLWLAAAVAAFVVEAKLPEDPMRAAQLVPDRIERDEMRLWEDGRPVAFAGWAAPRRGLARIGPVYTAPAARRHGYATALVAALSREQLDAGNDRVYLYTDVANPTSNAVYARIGFRPLRDLYQFDFVDP